MKIYILILAIALTACFSITASAQEKQTDATGWKTEVIPYLWFAGMSGDVTVAGHPVKDISISFSDVASNLDMGLAGHFETTKDDKWTLLFDFQYINVSEKPNLSTLRVKNTLAEIGATYHFNPWFETLGGARINYYKVEIEPGFVPDQIVTITGSKTWVDPFFGARASAKLGKSKKLTVSVRGDIGGFGAGTQFAWEMIFAGDYRFNNWGSFYIAERLYHADYGKSDKPFRVNLLTAGPVLGFGFHF